MLSRLLAPLALTSVLLVSPASAASEPETIRNHFDSDAPMRPPGYFEFTVLGSPGAADWKVLADYNPPSTPNQVTQTILDRPADSVAVALRRNVAFRDGGVSVGLRNGSGRAGLALRITKEKDCLLLLVDLESGEARLSRLTGGKSAELASGRIQADRAWSTLSVALDGPKVRAMWDDRPLLEATDPRPAAGRMGLATSGEGAAAFDELVIESRDGSPKP